jgi:hypothetical protein
MNQIFAILPVLEKSYEINVSVLQLAKFEQNGRYFFSKKLFENFYSLKSR